MNINNKAKVLMVSAGISLSLLSYFAWLKPSDIKSKHIVTMDIQLILNEFVTEKSRENIPEAQINQLVDSFSIKLTKVINDEAESHDYLILPKQAVLDGSFDITEDIKKKVLR